MQSFLIVLTVITSQGQMLFTDYDAPANVTPQECKAHANMGAQQLQNQLTAKGNSVIVFGKCEGKA